MISRQLIRLWKIASVDIATERITLSETHPYIIVEPADKDALLCLA